MGGRYDWVDTEIGDRMFGGTQIAQDKQASGRAGLSYLFDFGLAPYISFARSFEPVIGTDRLGNPFVPTKGSQIEAGVKYQPQGLRNSLITLAAYELTQENVLTPDPADPTSFSSIQKGEAQVRGFELEAVSRINEAFSFNLSYALADSEITESNGPDLGSELPVAARHVAAVFADYTIQEGPLAGLGFGGGVRYQSDTIGFLTEIPTRVPARTLVDALVHYDRAPWSFGLNASNLFDVTYLAACDTFVTTIDPVYGNCYYGHRRNVYATVSYRWGADRRGN